MIVVYSCCHLRAHLVMLYASTSITLYRQRNARMPPEWSHIRHAANKPRCKTAYTYIHICTNYRGGARVAGTVDHVFCILVTAS